MVLIWNELARGNAELCAVMVAFNSVLQIILYAPLSILYLNVSCWCCWCCGILLMMKHAVLSLLCWTASRVMLPIGDKLQ